MKLRRRYGRASTLDGRTIHVVGVLAGAYAGRGKRSSTKNVEDRTLLEHAIVEGAEKSLCGRIGIEKLSDWDQGNAPTCPACLKKYNKLTGG